MAQNERPTGHLYVYTITIRRFVTSEPGLEYPMTRVT